MFSISKTYKENIIKKFAIFYPEKDKVKIAPTEKIFPLDDLKYLSSGIQARVFKYEKFNWIVKEGRWDIDFDLFGTGKIPFNARLLEKVMSIFSYSFLPRLDEILRQYKLYLSFVEYFGYFEAKKSIYHPERKKIFRKQKLIRNSLLYYKPELEKHYKFKFNEKIDKILLSDTRFHNFLPKEYLLYGKSISEQNKDNLTYYIVQEYVEGYNLDKLDERDLPQHLTEQIILLLYLILLMDYQIGLLPDTRPKYIIAQIYNWLLRTDNIIVGADEVKFIDTRWFWDRNSNFMKRGMFVPEAIVNLSKGYINYLLEQIK